MLTTTLAQLAPAVDSVTSLGTAGLMGAMWLWERHTSRQREQQLDDAHDRILNDRVQLDALMTLVGRTAETLTRLAKTQEQLVRRLDQDLGVGPDDAGDGGEEGESPDAPRPPPKPPRRTT